MDVPAEGAGLGPFGIHGAQHLGGVRERPRPEYPPDDLAQRRQVGNLVERGADDGRTERRVGQRIYGVDRERHNHRYGPVIDPAAAAQLGQHRVPGRPDLLGGQQAAEEQVPVVRQPAPQPVSVI